MSKRRERVQAREHIDRQMQQVQRFIKRPQHPIEQLPRYTEEQVREMREMNPGQYGLTQIGTVCETIRMPNGSIEFIEIGFVPEIRYRVLHERTQAKKAKDKVEAPKPMVKTDKGYHSASGGASIRAILQQKDR